MKTPDEIKKGLEACGTLDGDCENCPYDDGKQLTCAERLRRDALEYILQLERKLEEEHEMCEFYRAKGKRQGSIIGQVSKTLCGKENTTYDELFQAVRQVKSRLVKVEKERDAAVEDIARFFVSPEVCKHYKYCQSVTDDPSHGCFGPMDCMDYEYRGVCEENTHDQP